MILVQTTLPSEPDAERLARELVDQHFAACCSISTRTRSIYRWLGEVVDEPEFVLTIKTTEARFKQVAQKIKELHPYDLPEIIAVPVVEVSEEYRRWVESEVEPGVE